jgi:hypothetical protein
MLLRVVFISTWFESGMKDQRSRSAKFTWVRAPMMSAPTRPMKAHRYIASAESRV